MNKDYPDSFASFDRYADLTNLEDLKEYSDILNRADQTDPNLVILDEQKQFCQNIENWKIFITTANILYKKLIK